MSNFIRQLTQEAHEIIKNINTAPITPAKRDELLRMALNNVADQANLITAAEILERCEMGSDEVIGKGGFV